MTTGKSFQFIDYSWDDTNTVLSLRYRLETTSDSYDFVETLELPQPVQHSQELDNCTRSLHLALGISYYKSFLPPTFVHPYEMSQSEATFWNEVYQSGLGELLYKNKLPINTVAKFTQQEGILLDTSTGMTLRDEVFLGIGGGKDSIVAGELLTELDAQISGFVLGTGDTLGQTKEVSDTMGIPLTVVKRRIDPLILQLNDHPDSYNGHIPISVIFALTGCLLALSNGSRYVVVANEASASIPSVVWDGMDINHQWSKSLHFERLFQQHVRSTIATDLSYFSAIRPLNSVAIAKLFAQYPEYFEVFTSDNSVFKIKQDKREHPRWSKDSSKSLSSFILLAPYMTDQELSNTFGTNFFDSTKLEPMFLRLLGLEGEPILDCVGTAEELRYSVQLLHEQKRYTDSTLMQLASDHKVFSQAISGYSISPSTDHAIPEPFEELISIMKQRLLK